MGYISKDSTLKQDFLHALESKGRIYAWNIFQLERNL